MRTSIATLLGALTVIAPSCSKPGAPVATALELELELEDEVAVDRGEARRVARLTVPVDIEPWEVKGGPRAVREGPQGQPVLRITAKMNRRVRIPGLYAAGDFDRVVVRGIFRGAHEVRVALQRGDAGRALNAPVVRARETREVQTLLFDVPELDHAAEPFDTLELRVRGPGGACEIHALDLWKRPLAARLPGTDEPPVRLPIGKQSRLARGLSSRSALVAELDVVAGHVLAFDCGQPGSLCDAARPATVSVSARSPLGEVHAETVLRPDDLPGRQAPWRSVRLDLSPLAGERATVRIELHNRRGREALAAITKPRVHVPAPDPPTVLLVTSDTHRGDHLGSLGDVRIETPALDALAARGVLFEDCWSSTNITVPSHASLLTALSNRDHRLLDNFGRLSDDATTLAERFRQAGYRTFSAVSVPILGARTSGLGQGFERTFAPTRGVSSAGDTTAALEEWLADAEGQPLFAWLHVYDAHYPYEPPAEFDRRYYPADVDPFDPSRPAIDAPRSALPQDLWELRDLEFPSAQYRAEISYLDRELGRLFEQPRVRRGIIAVTADHGEILASERQMYFNHAELYPETLHVPLILAWPGAPVQRVATPLSHLGLGRTLLDLAGLEDVAFPGRNLLEFARAPTERPRFAVSAHAFSASVAYGRWHLALHLRDHRNSLPGKRFRHEVELYDLRADPACVRNVVREHPDEARRLRTLLVEWLLAGPRTGLARTRATTSEERAELAALGYLSDEPPVEDSEWIDPDCACERCEDYR